MKIYAATDLRHDADPAGAPGNPDGYLTGLHDQLLTDLSARDCGQKRSARVATVFPSPKYPQESREGDKAQFERDWGDIGALSIGPPPVASRTAGGDSSPPTSGPTLLSASQRVYDAEITRRDSINGRCSAVLNTAGILGALVVGASQLGLIRGSFDWAAWIVYPLFVISLAYLTFSIVVALQVQGDIQGNVLGAQDLHRLGPELSPNGYSVYLAKADLLYATSEWCLNNEFKYRLNSAQRSLRNGIIAVIIAGALAPWALH
jgi:hypothetical protein